jgi:hypothetical protein
MVYVPYWDGAYWQGYVWGNATYIVRTAQDPSAMTNALRATIHKLDPELPLANVLTMREILSESVSSRRFQTLLTALFASAALLLACLGIYGVISYSVARRTNEIGIRIAIGAEPLQVSPLAYPVEPEWPAASIPCSRVSCGTFQSLSPQQSISVTNRLEFSKQRDDSFRIAPG